MVFSKKKPPKRAALDGLWDSNGSPVFPSAEITADDHDHDHEDDDEHAVTGSALWGWTMLACLVACMMSLAGVLLTAFPLVTGERLVIPLGVFNAAASGALVSAAGFLLIPEATELLADSEEWEFGTLLLVGFFTGVLVDYISQIARHQPSGSESKPQQSDDDTPIRTRKSIVAEHREASIVARFELTPPSLCETPAEMTCEGMCCTELFSGEKVPFRDFSRHTSECLTSV